MEEPHCTWTLQTTQAPRLSCERRTLEVPGSTPWSIFTDIAVTCRVAQRGRIVRAPSPACGKAGRAPELTASRTSPARSSRSANARTASPACEPGAPPPSQTSPPNAAWRGWKPAGRTVQRLQPNSPSSASGYLTAGPRGGWHVHGPACCPQSQRCEWCARRRGEMDGNTSLSEVSESLRQCMSVWH